jgi:hypothetical protein
MKKILLFTIALTMFVLSSCVSVHQQGRTYFKTDETRLELTMDDFTYLGEVTISAEYTKYGLITRIKTINGEKYNPRHQKNAWLGSNFPNLVGSPLQKSLYKVIEEYPEGTYFVPVNRKKDNKYMLGGKYVTETMTIKVYKLK